jgi:hypothetical protein
MKILISFVGMLAASSLASCMVSPASASGPAGPQYAAAAQDSPPVGLAYRPWTGPLSCDGTEDLQIDGADIQVNGDGPSVRGACSITIRNSRIVASGNALVVSGSGDIELVGSTISGATAVLISGAGSVVATQSSLSGRLVISGAGDIKLTATSRTHQPEITGAGELVE